jgi:hypothetical protein
MPGGYFLAGRTAQNPVKRKPNFRELRKAEVRRIPLPRTRLNRGALTAAVPWHILPLEKAIEETTR